jgi:hypothetical protein
MSRDEAIRKLNALPFGPSCGEGPWLVDALHALGILPFKEDRQAVGILNDLLDAVEKLAEIVAELNPGRTEDLRFIRFVLQRADRELNSGSQ